MDSLLDGIEITISVKELISICGCFLALLLDAFVLGQMRERKKLTGSVKPTLQISPINHEV